MSTYITVASDTSALVSRVKQVQQANREAQLQNAKDAALQVKLTAEVKEQAAVSDQPIGGNPDTSIDRRPAAYRYGGTAGVWHSYGTYELTPGNNDFAAYLRIADPTFTNFLDWRGPDFPLGELFSAFLPLGPETGVYIRTASDAPYFTVLTESVADGYQVNIGSRVPINPAYVTKVAIVGPRSIRELTPPDGLAEKMRHWGALGYTENQWALARHFGMLRPSGGGNTAYWTPAAFSGLNGVLDGVSSTNRSNYGYMRDNYFGRAPRLFLATQSFAEGIYDPLRVKWRQTTTQPATISSPVLESALRPASRSYWITLGEEVINEQPVTNDYQFYSAWNWGQRSYCRQQLLNLGFTSQDLTP